MFLCLYESYYQIRCKTMLETILTQPQPKIDTAVSELIGSCGGLLEKRLDSAERGALQIQGSMKLQVRYLRIRATGW